jgi:hypothetical protein
VSEVWANLFDHRVETHQWVLDNANSAATLSHGYQCVLKPGELLWIPDAWWHLTVNIGETGLR